MNNGLHKTCQLLIEKNIITVWRRLGLILYIIAILFATGILFECYTRYHVIATSFSYIKVVPDQFPKFKLIDKYQSNWITIRNGRRELAQRGKRPQRIAFIGDSVTFGSGVSDSVTFVELFQTG